MEQKVDRTQVEHILQKMREMIGEDPEAQVLFSEIAPERIPRQAAERQFVMGLPGIPEKYKHLIMVAVSAALGCEMCTEVFTKIAKRKGVSEGEIAEAILVARFAMASTIFATATPALRWLVGRK